MDIKEIVLKAGHSTVPAYWLSNEKPIACSTSNFERLVSFAEALVAELAKYRDAPVVAYRHLMEDGWEYFDAPTGDDCPKCVPLIVKPDENK